MRPQIQTDTQPSFPSKEGTQGVGNRLPYFRTPERIEALQRQLQQWAGTRWAHAGTRPNQMRCGVTGDCLFWVHAFKAIGALPAHIEIPDYRKMEAAGDQMRMLRNGITATRLAEEVFRGAHAPSRAGSDAPVGTQPANLPARAPTDTRAPRMLPGLPPLIIGDALLFHNGTSGAHCGLVVRAHPAHFVHLSRNGFLEEPLQQQHHLQALAFIYRLIEEDDQGAHAPTRAHSDALVGSHSPSLPAGAPTNTREARVLPGSKEAV